MQTVSYDDKLDDKLEEVAFDDNTITRSAEASSASLPARRRRWLKQVIMAFVLIVLGVSVGWFLRGGTESDVRISIGESSSRHDNLAISISTATVSYRDLDRYVDAIGSIHGFEDLTIAAKGEGRVLHLYHDMADMVNPNELLLEIDPTDMQLALNQAERALRAECERWGFDGVPGEDVDLDRLTAVRTSKLKMDLARSKLTRLNQLYKSNSVSADEFEQVNSDARIAESDWDNQRYLARSSLATVRLRESELNIARQKLKDTQIFAPTPTTEIHNEDRVYRIAKRMVSEGSLVRPGDALFRLVLGRSVKVRLTLQETHSATVAVGQSVELEATAGQVTSTGKVTRVSPVVDPVNRTFIVEVSVANERGILKPGGFARARIQVGHDLEVMTIPLSALDSFAGVNKVFSIQDGVATEHQVKLGYQQDDWIEITQPKLPVGSILATSSQRVLSTGSTVVDRNAETASP